MTSPPALDGAKVALPLENRTGHSAGPIILR
jgi:hypothetical protein